MMGLASMVADGRALVTVQSGYELPPAISYLCTWTGYVDGEHMEVQYTKVSHDHGSFMFGEPRTLSFIKIAAPASSSSPRSGSTTET